MDLQTPPSATASESARPWRTPFRELLEVAVAYLLIQGALWSYGAVQAGWAVAAAAWIIVTTALSRRSVRQLGIGWNGLRDSAWVVAAAVLLGGLLVLVAWLHGSLRPLEGAHTALWHAWMYAVWALLQEFIMQSFMYVRLEAAFDSRGRALLWTALLFAAAHVPNPILVPASFGLALVLIWLFARYRNIYTLAAAHAILGLVLSVTLPEALAHHMRVGIAYWI